MHTTYPEQANLTTIRLHFHHLLAPTKKCLLPPQQQSSRPPGLRKNNAPRPLLPPTKPPTNEMTAGGRGTPGDFSTATSASLPRRPPRPSRTARSPDNLLEDPARFRAAPARVPHSTSSKNPRPTIPPLFPADQRRPDCPLKQLPRRHSVQPEPPTSLPPASHRRASRHQRTHL